MRKSRRNRLVLSLFFVTLALWVATPKVYIHALLHHEHPEINVTNETRVKSQTANDCDFDRYNKPAYFSLFKFICSFIPSRHGHSGKISGISFSLPAISYAVPFLRGPPQAD